MKKTAKLLLVMICFLCLLTGCYQNDTELKITQSGKVKVEISNVTNDDGAAMVFGATYDEVGPGLVSEIDATITDTSKEKVEEVNKDVDGQNCKGIKYTGYYDSLDEMYSSQVYNSVMNFSGVPVFSSVLSFNGQPVGVGLKESKSVFGRTYTGTGTINYDIFREAMGINGDGEAKINLAIRFPFGSFTFSKGNKNIFVPAFVYNTISNEEPVEINFKVFVPNYIMVLFVLLFILLIVFNVLLILKVKNLQKIIAGEDEITEEIQEEGETFISEDDENFFEGNEERVEFKEEIPETTEEPEKENPEETE